MQTDLIKYVFIDIYTRCAEYHTQIIILKINLLPDESSESAKKIYNSLCIFNAENR